MSLLYKTLFEVKLMHEFFLTQKNGDQVFSLTNQADRISFLFAQFTQGRPSVNDNLAFSFPPDLEKEYSSYHLKLLSGYSGFKIAICVNQKMLADGTLVYEPLASLPDGFNVFVQLVKKSNVFESYTHSGINDPVPSVYIFSNENISGAKTFPFLTNPISAFDAAHSYTQGDFASFGINDVREYYKNGMGDQWETIAGTSFANENDRLLVPMKFYYSFINTNNITNATFVLKDKNGNSIKTITASKENPFQKVFLDFSGLENVIAMPEKFQYSDIIFSLEVSGNNGYSALHNLIFSDALNNSENWGVVNIKTKVTNSSFDILANDGFLMKRRMPPGTWNDAPVFEIPVKSKFPYWRFINEKGKELKLAPALTDYLSKENKILLSKRPRSVSASCFLLQKEGSSDTIYVPNPLNYDLKKDDKERLYCDIVVPESELFPVVP
jgi:hypothetical protein